MQRRANSKQLSIFFLLAAAAVLVSGCASTKGFLGLATVSYVDEELGRIEQEDRRRSDDLSAELERISSGLAALEADLERVKADLEAYDELSAEIRQALTDFSAVQEATAELQLLAEQVAEELERLPRETVRQIVDALQAHLEGLEQPDGK